MELGARLRQARLEAGLSQKQLCGDTITRNMLSLIENGAAHPSMDTLLYLARQLNRPVSYFLDEEVSASPNEARIRQLRESYAAGDYPRTAALLEQYQSPDPVFDEEKNLLEALTAAALARQALDAQKPGLALRLLRSAEDAARRTVYGTAPLQRELLLLRSEAEPEKASALAGHLQADDRALLLLAAAAAEAADFSRCAALLEAASDHTAPRWCFLRGEAYRAKRQYRQAAAQYLKAEQAMPQAVYPRLEQCYRELNNYKMAYFYACKQR